MTRAGLIERLADRQPGRRGFGGSDDPLEAAAFRVVLRGDHDLNPGMTPPSTALRPAAVLVPLIDHAGGSSGETAYDQPMEFVVQRRAIPHLLGLMTTYEWKITDVDAPRLPEEATIGRL